jgi:hypothetical protein
MRMTQDEIRRAAHDFKDNDPDRMMFDEFAAKSDRDAIRDAALSRSRDGIKYDHQRRIPNHILLRASELLLEKVHSLLSSDDFDDLHDLVEQFTTPISGFGKLCVYDTALRIGSKYGKMPSRIYLHAGVKTGYRKLLRDLDLTQPMRLAQHLSVESLPDFLRFLMPDEAESFLCLYNHL